MSPESRVGWRGCSASALIFTILSIAGACIIAAIAFVAIRFGGRLDGGSVGADVSTPPWSLLVGAASVVTIALASAAFTLRALIVAPLTALAAALNAAAEPATEFRLSDTARLAAAAQAMAALARSQEREFASEREARLRAELAAAEQAGAHAESRLLGLGPLSEALACLARGDLRVRLSEAREVHPMGARLDQTVELFAKTMLAFSASLDAIHRGAAEMNASVDAYGEEMAKLAARVEVAMNAAARGSESATELAAPLSASASELRAWIEETSRVAVQVQQGGASLGAIRQTARKIEPVLTSLDEVAFQTNFLALNAGIEAARVGDAGRGMAVVAQELRLLSQRATEAVKESSGLLSRVLAEAERGVVALSAPAQAQAALAERAAKVIGVLEQTGLKLADRKIFGETARALSESIAAAATARTQLDAEMQGETDSLETLLGRLSALVARFDFPSDHASRFRASSERVGAPASLGAGDRERRGLPPPAANRWRRS